MRGELGEGVGDAGDVVEDGVDGAGAVDGVVGQAAVVVFLEGFGLAAVNFEALGYGLGVVVAASAFESAFEQALCEFFFGHFEAYNGVDFGAAFFEHFVEGFGLGNGAGEAVENHSFCVGVCVEFVFEYVEHELVGDEVTFGYECVGNLAQFGSARNVVAQEFAGRYVVEAVALNEAFALGSFAGAGGAENNYIHA